MVTLHINIHGPFTEFTEHWLYLYRNHSSREIILETFVVNLIIILYLTHICVS